ncbi:hypothetical protein IKQ26_09445 [bacterium]|nr:hypothetical protein [bacterium]
MGLAACQARYLSITARKTNVEYEALQINQQRTSLATRTSEIYNKLCSLDQPVQPSPVDYYKTDYSYSVTSGDESGNYTIDSYVKNTGADTYTVYATRTYDTQTASRTTSSQVTNAIDNGDGTFTLTFADGSQKIYSTTSNSQTIIDIINKALGTQAIPDGEQLYQYTDTDSGNVHYLTNTELQELLAGTATTYNDYSVYKTSATEKVTINDASLEFDTTGRLTKISTPDYTNVEVNSTTQFDEIAYQQAMKVYNAKQADYDSEVKRLQNETNRIQQQDKTLELKLDQLDTEQQTLKTELESVTKLLDDNVKNIFNTFNSSG